MNKPESNKRLLWFAVLVFLLASAKIGYAAVPQSTIRTTDPGGITTYVGHYGNFTLGIFQGATERLSATGAATFTGVTGTSFIIGANTLDTNEWAFLDGTDQSLAQASSPTFNAITGTSFVIGANTLSTSEWGYLDGVDQSLAQASAVTFSSVDTGHGANDLYDMDLNVLQANDVSFASVNATTEFYRNGDNYTAWVESAILAGPGGGWPVFDQDLNTTDNVSFASVNATDEFYRGGVNYTATIEGLIVAGAGSVFDQGLNTTDDVTFDNITASDTITLGGVPRTAWPAVGGGSSNKTGYDFYTYRSGATYYFQGANGTTLSSADFDATFNGIMEDYDYTCSFYLEQGTYTYDTTLLFLGPNPTVSFGNMPVLQGAGRGATILDPAASVNAITLRRGVSAQIYDLTIDMATTGDPAFGIYGDPSGGSVAYTECGAYKSQVKRIAFKGGVAGGAAMKMINTEWCQFGDLHSYMSSGCNGFLFYTNAGADYSYCENTFTDYISVFIAGDDTIGMGFFGADHDHACNQMQGTGYIYIRSASGANTTGVWFRYADFFSMGRFHIEECDRLVYANYCYSGIIDGGHTYSIADNAGDTLISLVSCYTMTVRNWHLFVGALNPVTWLYDNRNDANQYNAAYNIVLHNNNGNITQSVTITTDLNLIRQLGSGTFP